MEFVWISDEIVLLLLKMRSYVENQKMQQEVHTCNACNAEDSLFNIEVREFLFAAVDLAVCA